MSEDRRREPGLFDLPLEPLPDAPLKERAAATTSPSRGGQENLPLFTEDEVDSALDEALEPPTYLRTGRGAAARSRPVPVPAPPPAPPLAGVAPRLRATCGDLAALVAAGVLAALGAQRLDAPLGREQLAPLAMFVLSFSFLYFVVPLAFWGGTPGMIWSGLAARTQVSEPLSFGQTVMRWIGTWMTWALLGLPGLLALTGRSLADRLSGSSTYLLTAPSATN